MCLGAGRWMAVVVVAVEAVEAERRAWLAWIIGANWHLWSKMRWRCGLWEMMCGVSFGFQSELARRRECKVVCGGGAH